MKKKITLTFCLLLVFFISFAGKFVLIPVTETNNLISLFNNKDLKIHYYCDDYILATAEKVNYNGTVILDEHAFADVNFYAIVYYFEDQKDDYLAMTSKSAKTLFSGENFLIMKILSNDFAPAKNDGMVAVMNFEARLPKSAAAYPVITEQDEDVLDYISQVSTDTLMAYIKTLENFVTRNCLHPNAVAAQNWIKKKYESFGLYTYLQEFPLQGYWGISSDNVIAIQYGTEFPDEYIVCGAHYDSYTFQSQDDAPGADDNASGTASILEIARVLSQYESKRSIIYCAFSGEEYGLYGSYYYALQCANQDMNIVGYFNLDMTGYLTPGREIHIDLIYPSSAQTLANYYINVCGVYFPEIPIRSFSSLPWGNSDHTSFNIMGYKGIWPFEDIYENSPYIHNVPHYDPNYQFEYLGDIIGPSVNNPEQVTVFAKTKVASIATLAMHDQAMPPPPLASPTNCVAVPYQSRRIKVTWEAPVENTPGLYYVYRDGVKIAETNHLQYINTLSVNDHNVYCYKVTAVYYYGGESEFSNESCTSVLNITEYSSKFNIYPNPAKDKLYITSDKLQVTSDKLEIEIFVATGRKISSHHLITSSSHHMIDISGLTSGVYFIKILNDVVGKFVKE